MLEIARTDAAIEPASTDDALAAGHNGGPPLDDHTPEWGRNGIGNYFSWKAAHRAAWNNPSPGIVAFRIARPNGSALPTKSTRSKSSNAAVTCRSRMSSGLPRSSRHAHQGLRTASSVEQKGYCRGPGRDGRYRNQTTEPLAGHPHGAERTADRSRRQWRLGLLHGSAANGDGRQILGERAGCGGACRSDHSRRLRRRSAGRNGNVGAGPFAKPAAPGRDRENDHAGQSPRPRRGDGLAAPRREDRPRPRANAAGARHRLGRRRGAAVRVARGFQPRRRDPRATRSSRKAASPARSSIGSALPRRLP